MHLVQEEPRLALGTAIRREEMVHAAHEVVLTSLIEIFVEIVVHQRNTLGGLDEDKAYRVVVDTRIPQYIPLYLTLIVADVNAADVVTLGIGGLATE